MHVQLPYCDVTISKDGLSILFNPKVTANWLSFPAVQETNSLYWASISISTAAWSRLEFHFETRPTRAPFWLNRWLTEWTLFNKALAFLRLSFFVCKNEHNSSTCLTYLWEVIFRKYIAF